MYPFLVSFFCLFLLLPVFKREEGLVCYTERIPVSLCFYVKQKSEICLHHKGHIAVHLGAIFDETGSGVLMIADEQFLFSLSKLSRSKEVAYKREEKSYFSLPLFFLSLLFAQRGRGKELRKKDTLLSLSRNEIRNQDS